MRRHLGVLLGAAVFLAIGTPAWALSDETATGILLVLGGGINIAVNDTIGLDFGYRWNGIFTEDPMIYASEVCGGVRINFR